METPEQPQSKASEKEGTNKQPKRNRVRVAQKNKSQSNGERPKTEETLSRLSQISLKVLLLSQCFSPSKPDSTVVNITDFIKNPKYKYSKILDHLLLIFEAEKENIFDNILSILGAEIKEGKKNVESRISNFLNSIAFFVHESVLTHPPAVVTQRALDTFIQNLKWFHGQKEMLNYIKIFNLRALLTAHITGRGKDSIFETTHLYSILDLISVLNLQKEFKYMDVWERHITPILNKEDYINTLQHFYNTYRENSLDIIELCADYQGFILPVLKKYEEEIPENIRKKIVMNHVVKPHIDDNLAWVHYYLAYEPFIDKNRFFYEVNSVWNAWLESDWISLCIRLITGWKGKQYIDKTFLYNLIMRLQYSQRKTIGDWLPYWYPRDINKIIADFIQNNEVKNLCAILRTHKEIKVSPRYRDFLNHNSWKQYLNYQQRESKDTYDILVEKVISSEHVYHAFLDKLVYSKKIAKFYDEIFYLVNQGTFGVKQYPIPNQILSILQKNFEYDGKPLPTKYDAMYSKNSDLFAPRTIKCIQLDEDVNVVFIDTVSTFEAQFKSHFITSEYIGIDTEWLQTMTFNQAENIALIQLSDYSERNVMLIDGLKWCNDKEFIRLFAQFFRDKKFVGFSFDKNDMNNMNTALKEFFLKCEVIDIRRWYSQTRFRNCPSLASVCLEILGENMCKYEQCSNWENRPLRNRQRHYAAWDAIACVRLFKELNKEIIN